MTETSPRSIMRSRAFVKLARTLGRGNRLRQARPAEGLVTPSVFPFAGGGDVRNR